VNTFVKKSFVLLHSSWPLGFRHIQVRHTVPFVRPGPPKPPGPPRGPPPLLPPPSCSSTKASILVRLTRSGHRALYFYSYFTKGFCCTSLRRRPDRDINPFFFLFSPDPPSRAYPQVSRPSSLGKNLFSFPHFPYPDPPPLLRATFRTTRLGRTN